MQKHLKTKQKETGKGPFSGCRNDWQTPGPSGPRTKRRAAAMRRAPFKPETTDRLGDAEKELGLGPVAMARAMGVSYGTYKDWRSGRRAMPPVAIRCLELLAMYPRTAKRLGTK